MNALTLLFDASARRRKRLDDLVARRAQQQAEFDALIAAGDDADADKALGKLQKLDAEIAAARAVIESTERAVVGQRQVAADADRQRRESIAITAQRDYVREATEFVEAVAALRERWRLTEAAFAIALRTEHQARDAGSSLRTVTERRITPTQVWQRAFAELQRGLIDAGLPAPRFGDLPARAAAEPILRRLERERDAHPQPTKDIE